MNLALVTMSHSPLLHHVEPQPETKAAVDHAFAKAREFAHEFDPDLVINFGPDHYNGFFYDIMPPFCVGYEATAIGDFGGQAGELDVPSDLVDQLVRSLFEQDVDMTVSMSMQVDHGAVQPMELMYGDFTAKPTIPIFINSVAPPFSSVRRIRAMGEAVGRFARELDKKVLVIGSGGLSHEPPVPKLAGATPEVRERLLGGGRVLSPEARYERETRVIDAAKAYAAGEGVITPIAPEWDREFMRILASGELERMDDWAPEEMARIAGNSVHEVRTWIAAFAALRAAGDYSVDFEFYEPIKEYIAGFGVMTASLR